MLWALVLPAASADSAGTTAAGGPRAPLGAYAVVNNPSVEERLNLRKNPSRASGSLARFDNGTTVEILEQSETWCRVRIDEKTRYMLTKYLLMDSRAATHPGTRLSPGAKRLASDESYSPTTLARRAADFAASSWPSVSACRYSHRA